MNDSDLNLIVDLIESQLSTSEAETALARIMADPELSSAYAEQLAVRTSLADVAAASMTVAEKDALNSALVAQLRLEDAPATVVPIAPKRKTWWMPVVGIATAAAAFTAIFIMPGLSGSDDSSDAASADITIVASAAAPAPEDSEADDGTAQLDRATGGSGVAEEESFATAAAPVTVIELAGADLDEVLDATQGKSSPEAVEDQLNALGFTESAAVASDVLAECVSSISRQLPPNATDIVLYGVDTSGPTQIAHLGIVFDDGIGAAMSVDLASCSVIDLGN